MILSSHEFATRLRQVQEESSVRVPLIVAREPRKSEGIDQIWSHLSLDFEDALDSTAPIVRNAPGPCLSSTSLNEKTTNECKF